jgi:hypothetical protein
MIGFMTITVWHILWRILWRIVWRIVWRILCCGMSCGLFVAYLCDFEVGTTSVLWEYNVVVGIVPVRRVRSCVGELRTRVVKCALVWESAYLNGHMKHIV